jgi:hypothetical protein
MTDIPQTAEEFEAWLLRTPPMPPDLYTLGRHALLTLRSLNQANAAKSPAFMKASADDLKAFADAYTAWRAGQH